MNKKFADLTDKICIRVEQKIESGLAIFLVEYVGEGKTVKQIRDKIKGYKNLIKVSKRGSDGSSEIVNAIKYKNIAVSSLELCGIFASCCVDKTALGLKILDEIPFFINLSLVGDIRPRYNTWKRRWRSLGIDYV